MADMKKKKKDSAAEMRKIVQGVYKESVRELPKQFKEKPKSRGKMK